MAGRSPLPWVIAFGIFSAFAFAAGVLFTRTNGGPTAPYCIGNLKDTAKALLMYSCDADDGAPLGPWMTELAPYAGGEHSFTEPSPLTPTIRFGYAMNQGLLGAKSYNQPESDKRAAFFDCSVDRRNAVEAITTLPSEGRHEGKNEVAYADGHVAAIPGEQR